MNDQTPIAAPAASPAKSKYSRATLEAVHRIEQAWKSMEDSDRIILSDSIESALQSATLDSNNEATQDFDTIVEILTKHAARSR